MDSRKGLLMIKAAIKVMIFFETKQLPNMDLYRYSALVREMTAIDPGVMASSSQLLIQRIAPVISKPVCAYQMC